MATILEFPQSRLRMALDSTALKPGEIVIFPGVRIERSEFNLAERLPGRRRKTEKAEARTPTSEF